MVLASCSTSGTHPHWFRRPNQLHARPGYGFCQQRNMHTDVFAGTIRHDFSVPHQSNAAGTWHRQALPLLVQPRHYQQIRPASGCNPELGLLLVGSTLLTVTVTPGYQPTSTGLTVTCDLSSHWRVPNPGLFTMTASNGDVTAGDNIFSYSAIVSASTTNGAKTLACTIIDAEGRSGSASISLTVQAAPPSAGSVVISQVYGGGGNSGATL